MNDSHLDRIDEVSRYYKYPKKFKRIGALLFWVIAILSLFILYSAILSSSMQNFLQIVFIIFVIILFTISQISRFYLVPRAERMRRKQILSDAFGAPLSHDKTSLYYNNAYSPSIQRLGADTMENCLFSKEIAAKMLFNCRLFTGGYVITWLLAFALRHNNLEILIWITQIVFSGEILVQWINLEVLHFRHERIYEQLHAYFFNEISADSPRTIATVLDAFVAYEASKLSAGLLLSTKIFHKLNPELSKKWNRICQELKMDFQKDAAALEGDFAGPHPSGSCQS